MLTETYFFAYFRLYTFLTDNANLKTDYNSIIENPGKNLYFAYVANLLLYSIKSDRG